MAASHREPDRVIRTIQRFLGKTRTAAYLEPIRFIGPTELFVKKAKAFEILYDRPPKIELLPGKGEILLRGEHVFGHLKVGIQGRKIVCLESDPSQDLNIGDPVTVLGQVVWNFS
jgi:hypothetical protein